MRRLHKLKTNTRPTTLLLIMFIVVRVWYLIFVSLPWIARFYLFILLAAYLARDWILCT